MDKFGVRWAIHAALALAVYAVEAPRNPQTYTEDLLIRPLADGQLMAHLSFKSTIELAAGETLSHFETFPKSIAQLIQHFHVNEMHLSFTQGRWFYHRWGHPPVPQSNGAELLAWFDSSLSPSGVARKWKGLAHTLSGLFSASLNFLVSEPRTFQPQHAFEPDGDRRLFVNDTAYVRYGTMVREASCTENLTPWLKLLPSKAVVGLAALLSPRTLFGMQHHSMGVHVRHVCVDDGCARRRLVLDQTLTFVLRASDGTTATSSATTSSANLRSIFGDAAGQFKPFALAGHTRMFVEVPEHVPLDSMVPDPARWLERRGARVAEYKLAPAVPKGWKIKWTHRSTFESQPQIVTQQFTSGAGLERGGTTLQLSSSPSANEVAVSLLQALPWFLRVYLHSLRITIDGTAVEPSEVLRFSKITPAQERLLPTIVELGLKPLRNVSVVAVSFDVEKAYLRIHEHPPDANRGFDIPPAIVRYRVIGEPRPTEVSLGGLDWSQQLDGTDQAEQTEAAVPERSVYTDGGIVNLPTPDFSMPYNVITLTCTVVALFFGSTFNVLTRKLDRLGQRGLLARKDAPLPRLVATIWSFIRRKMQRTKPAVVAVSADTAASPATGVPVEDGAAAET